MTRLLCVGLPTASFGLRAAAQDLSLVQGHSEIYDAVVIHIVYIVTLSTLVVK